MSYKIVIPVIAIVCFLVTSGFAIEAFADHLNPDNADKRMVVFKIKGNNGGDHLDNDVTFTQFYKDNNAVDHFSSWNSYFLDEDHDTYFALGFLSTCDENGTCQWGQNVNAYADYFDTHGQSKRFIMEGYSYGGGATRFITTDPRNSDVQFDMVWLLDPVGTYSERMTLSSICPDDPFPGRFGFIPHVTFIDVGVTMGLFCNIDARNWGTNTIHAVGAFQKGGPPPIHSWIFDLVFRNANNIPIDYVGLPNPPLGFGTAHSAVETAALGEGIVWNVMKGANNGPQFSILPDPITFDEGSSITETIQATDILTKWDKHANLRFWVPSISPEIVLTDLNQGSLSIGSLIRTGSVSIFADDNSTSKIMLQVEDNGFPCGNCTGNLQALSNNALGWWQNKTSTVIVNNVPPTIVFGFGTFQGSDLKLFLETTDPSNADTAAGFDYEFDWDDGSPIQTIHGSNIDMFTHSYLSGIYTVKVTATDKDGGESSEFTITVSTPFYRLLEDIEDLKNDGTLNKGQANSLTSKVEAILQDIDKGNFTPACNVADALINEINAFVKSKKLTQAQADELLETIDEEKDPIGCNGGVISVVKQTTPDGDTTQFTFTGDVSGTIGDDEQIKIKNLTSGTYDSTETVPNSWVLGTVICSDDNSFRPDSSNSATYILEDAEFVVCLFLNEFSDEEVVFSSSLERPDFAPLPVVAPTLANSETESVFAPDVDWREFYSEIITTGNVTINGQTYEIDENTLEELRSGNVTINGQTFSIEELMSSTSTSDNTLPTVHASDFAEATFNTVASNPSSAQPSDDVTDDKGSGGDEHLTRPTFGLSHETFETIVDSGFRFNDQSFTINDNHHTPFAQQTVNIGEVNSFEAKIYADKGLRVQEFIFGIPNVGEAHLAELGVEVWYGYDGEIEEIKAIQKSNVIDKETIIVTHEKTKCQATDSEEKCDVTNLSVVFLEPLKDKVMAVKAIDFKNRYQITYLNEGVEIFGESLNPMSVFMIPSTVKDEGLVQVTQTAKYSPYWLAEDGRLFEMNKFGSFKEINQSFERFEDTGNPYTRVHSGFAGIIAYEQKRAFGVFNSTELIAELPESFAYLYPESDDRVTEEMKQKMLEQEAIAKKIIEESKVQARW